jgi:hypothetical protein
MEKASKAIRRSGVRLKSLGGGHSDLNMVISELKDVRQAAKAFMQAQNSAAQDMLKWSVHDPNRAVQDVVSQLAELNSLWTEVQKEFTENLKDFKYQFEMILEGERHVDQARNHMAACEQQELKIKKELKKAAKKATTEELNRLEIKLGQAERAKDLAQLEVIDRIRENEMIKLVRFKDGMVKVSEAYVELATKCAVIFEAQRDISHHLPDIHGRDIHEIKYTGSGATKQTVMRARDKVRGYRRHSHLIPRSLPVEEPPPPYTQHYCDNISISKPYGLTAPTPAYNMNVVAARNLEVVDNNCDNRQYHPRFIPPRQRAEPSCPRPDSQQEVVRWNNDYEDDLSGAMGGAKI